MVPSKPAFLDLPFVSSVLLSSEQSLPAFPESSVQLNPKPTKDQKPHVKDSWSIDSSLQPLFIAKYKATFPMAIGKLRTCEKMTASTSTQQKYDFVSTIVHIDLITPRQVSS